MKKFTKASKSKTNFLTFPKGRAIYLSNVFPNHSFVRILFIKSINIK